jgi:hypothetical protein
MLTVIRATNGQLEAVCEWTPVDDNGIADVHGKWIFVHQLEMTQGVRRSEVIRAVIWQIATLMPHAMGAYWQRHDQTHERLHWYLRGQLVKPRQEVRV